jgi:hypothetical protein
MLIGKKERVMTELKDWLNSINLTKKNLIDEDPSLEKEYPPYIINRCFSGHLDAIMFANEMNQYHFLDKKLQYDFLLNTLRTKKRFSPWLRKDTIKDLDLVKRYYGYSNEKASRKEKKIYQSCHILHKQGRYYLVHFKELFALDGKHANLTLNDVQRRNRIAQLIADWGLVSIVDTDKIQDIAPLNQIKVLSYKDKGDWILETKYNIGSKKKKVDDTE